MFLTAPIIIIYRIFWPLKISNTSLHILVDIEDKGDTTYLSLKQLIEEKVVPKVPGGVKFSCKKCLTTTNHHYCC